MLKTTDLKSYSNTLLIAIRGHRHQNHVKARAETRPVLGWFWHVAISPILEELEFTESGRGNTVLPRIWRVGSGLLNILPMHAAGCYESGSTRNVLDQVLHPC